MNRVGALRFGNPSALASRAAQQSLRARQNSRSVHTKADMGGFLSALASSALPLGWHTAIGGVQAVLALTWKNPFGVLVGLACVGAGKNYSTLKTAAAVLAAIHLVSLDRPVTDGFPQTTFGSGAVAGSCRIADTQPRNNNGLQPPIVPGSLKDVEDKVVSWIKRDAQGRTAILYRSASDKSVYIHSRHVSLVFGFGDDVFINITDIGGGKCKVEYQGQLRLGGSDLGVNYNRGKSLVDTLKASS